MKVKKIFALIIAILVLNNALVANALEKESLEEITLENLVEYDRFETAAKSSIIMEAETGRIFYGNNIHKRLPMASTTKIMGALLVLEQPNLDEYFTVDSDAIHVEGSSMGLKEGDKVTLRALAYGMILPSGNDAANAAGVRIYGSIEAFVEQMNRKAVELGLEDTHYVTACGLDAEGHYSSAFDLAKLTRIALENSEFAMICSKYNAQVNFGNPPFDRWLKNHNRLLELYEDCIGVKTGFTDGAKRCLVSAARHGDVTLICVTLNAEDDWNLHINLYEKYWKEISKVNLASFMPKTEIFITDGKREKLELSLEYEPVVPLRDSERGEIRCEVIAAPMAYAPVRNDTILGEAVFMLADEILCKVPLRAENIF